MNKTLYQKNKNGKIQEWNIRVDENGNSGFPEIHITFGLMDGKKQTTFDIVKSGVNIGKANETTALQQACLEAERAITKQIEEGYCESLNDALKDQNINFVERLPKNLCFYKPKNSIEETKIQNLERSGRLINTLKRDGMMHICRKSKEFGVEIYTRRMDLATEKYPHLESVFNNLPDGTILLGEIILNQNGKDNFNVVSKICRSDKEIAIQKQKEFGNVSYYIFDIAYHNYDCLLNKKSYRERLEILKNIVKELNNEFVLHVHIFKNNLEAMKYVKDNNLEGLVLWDANGIIKEGEAWTFNGKAYRPNVVFKHKPIFEDDFICIFDPDNGIGDWGTGKNKNKMKNVCLYQLDKNNNKIYLGKCGGGLTEQERDFYTSIYPFERVWKIEFSAIQQKTGALRFPVFNSDRTKIGDKEISECLLSDAIKAAIESDENYEDDEGM